MKYEFIIHINVLQLYLHVVTHNNQLVVDFITFVNSFDSNYYSTGRPGPPPSREKFEMFVDIRCPIRVECILSCSTTSAFCPANPARGCILAEFCHSLTDFRANLSSLIKASLF